MKMIDKNEIGVIKVAIVAGFGLNLLVKAGGGST